MGSKLQLNQKVSIQKTDSADNQFYSSYITAMEEDTISLATPMYRGGLVLFNKEEQIRVYAWPLVFITRVLERHFLPHPILIVERPRVFIKDQKRSFVRLEISLPIVIRELTGGPLSRPIGTEIKTHTVDISGGGALVVYPRELPLGTWLELEIYLPEKISCRAQVRRLEHINEAARKVRVAVEFAEIAPAEQDKIIAFIFQRHRELRRQGLL